jgi:hypothetical protein
MKYSRVKSFEKIALILIIPVVVCFASACSSKTDQSAFTNQSITGNQSANERINETTRNSPANSVFNQTDNNGQGASQPGLKPPILPDAKLTPGDTLEVTKDDICVSGYSKKVRDVPQAVKEQAYKEYGITQREPGEYEIDHLISLELGGSNSIRNLWPESFKTAPWNARVKDKLENKLHEMICNGQIDIKTAQREIATTGWNTPIEINFLILMNYEKGWIERFGGERKWTFIFYCFHSFFRGLCCSSTF